ncbi:MULTISPECIES: MDR family MFS transporter [unclassified Actinopolyspora]|uniref:MDR family MFS transporter n=1 Tax=unclassified Actinopolyspora TaxID=2639451 RepID=UPI0013F616D7|nr:MULTISPECIES: MDR family MFS transporter [unclassified Actinopolyspora]NHD19338.1 multidrug efflux MFS transporter [Actinopolyspora sp. BKK2]NHE78462.1 multidrug efflux MFS transporter [Actinopolyspora sp. BKK1]
MTSTRPAKLEPRLVRLVGIMMLGAMLSAMDSTVLAVAVHSIGQDFGVSAATVQSVNVSYLLAMCMSIPVTGWAIERFGGTRMWMFALTTFLVGSVCCGLSWDLPSLVVFRIVQGVGGGMIIPIAQVILGAAANSDQMGRVMALLGGPTQLAPVLGPVLGGLIVDSLHWRWAFYLNVPLVLIGLIIAWRGLPREEGRATTSLDVLGLTLLSSGLAALVYGLSGISGAEGVANAGSATVLVCSLVGVLLLGAYTVHALRMRSTPIIDVRLFAFRKFGVAAALVFLSGSSLFSVTFLLPLYYQQARGDTALDAGFLLAPQGIGIAAALFVCGSLADRYGARPVVVSGLLIVLLGTVAYLWVTPQTSEVLLSASLLVRGFGLGAAAVPMMASIYQAGLPESAMPRAVSAVSVAQRLGGAFGTALVATVLNLQLASAAPSGGVASPEAVASAFAATFGWTMAFTTVALVLAWFLPTRRPVESA